MELERNNVTNSTGWQFPRMFKIQNRFSQMYISVVLFRIERTLGNDLFRVYHQNAIEIANENF